METRPEGRVKAARGDQLPGRGALASMETRPEGRVKEGARSGALAESLLQWRRAPKDA